MGLTMEARDFVTDLLSWGWTQEQIADETEISQGSVSKIHRGAVKDVLSGSYRKLQELHAKANGRPPELVKQEAR